MLTLRTALLALAVALTVSPAFAQERPNMLTTQPSHGHDQTIVNGISRIGYMTGGRAALWKDDEMALVFTRQSGFKAV